MARQGREAELMAQLKIEPSGRTDHRLIVFGDVVLGRLERNEKAGTWRLEWRAGWQPLAAEFAGADAEHAEAWAVKEIAAVTVMERKAYEV